MIELLLIFGFVIFAVLCAMLVNWLEDKYLFKDDEDATS